MNWQQLKDKVYYCDGSLRDIYVHNTTKADWQIWAEYVNQNYKTTFHIYDTDVRVGKVDLKIVLDYWTGKLDNCSTATVLLDDIQLNTHFFSENEIENDIAPQDINTIADHYKVIKYMVGLSNALNKRVTLTPENTPDIVHISVLKEKVEINFD
ncbi:MAG: hypothetical protein H6605_02430 [Flavobacteriales bacterium]|nr:hypothetical protein [Flavobacteriales bacterium]